MCEETQMSWWLCDKTVKDSAKKQCEPVLRKRHLHYISSDTKGQLLITTKYVAKKCYNIKGT